MTQVRIERIAAGGEGVGRMPDGRVVFVPRVAPGDLVELRDVDVKKRFARARSAVVIEPSPERAEPPCRHFGPDRCGGCAFQHLGYAAQLRAKSALVGDALRRIGKLDVADPPVRANARPLAWRSRISLAVRRGVAGFRPEGDPEHVFELVRCEIASPAIQSVWEGLRAGAPWRTGGDAVLSISLREDRAGQVHVVVAFRVATPDESRDAVAAAFAACAPSSSSTGLPTVRVWTSIEDREPTPADGKPGALPAFEQVDRSMGDLIREAAVAALGDVRGRTVWDLYSGTGDAAALLAAAGAAVHAVEADPVAAELFRGRGIAGAECRTQRVEDAVGSMPVPAAVYANPPRAGISRSVLGAILDGALGRGAPERIVYVSCDPATLARDLAVLAPSYALSDVQAFDAFPQTAHVEVLALLVRVSVPRPV